MTNERTYIRLTDKFNSMTRDNYLRLQRNFGGEKILQLIDREGNIIRSCVVNSYPKVQKIKSQWGKLYGKNKSFKYATYKLVDR